MQKIRFLPERILHALTPNQINWKKMMRNSSLVVTGFFLAMNLLIASPGKGQYIQKRIDLSLKNKHLQELFKQIEERAGVDIMCEITPRLLKETVSIHVKAQTIEEILNTLLLPRSIRWSARKNYILIQDAFEAKLPNPVPQRDSAVMEILTIRIKGRVLDEKGEPVFGATVQVKGTQNITTTNTDGEFFLSLVEPDAVLVFTAANIETQFVKVENRHNINVIVTKKVSKLDDVMVVAYGRTTQKANTASVTVVKGEQIQNLPSLSVDRSLQGLVPGLLVTQGTGQPGGGVSNFVLRGISTGGNSGDASTVRNPLFIIDGVPVQQDPAQGTTSAIAFNNPMAQLNPADIESISVLKDAAAISLYGSKASNGVILVTTKRGTSGKTTINFRHQTDIATRLTGTATPLNRDQYLELYFEAYRNTNPGAADAEISASLRKRFPYNVKSPGDTSFYEEPNWINELYNRNALTLSNNLSISGSNNKNNYYLNLEYTKQDGVQKNTGYDRKSLTFNYENRPADWIKLGLKTTFSYNVQDFGSEGSSENTIMGISPLNSVRDNNGNLIKNYTWGMSQSSEIISGGSPTANPLAAAELNINRNISYRAVTDLSGEIKFLKHLTFSGIWGFNFMLTETKQTTHPTLTGASVDVGVGRVFGNSLRNNNLIATNILRYDNVFAKEHSISVQAGHEAQSLTDDYKYVMRINTGFNPLSDQLRSGQIKQAEGEEKKQRLLSYFGQLNYGFRNRYFLSAGARTDGSSLFGDHKKFGAHWSVGLGWVVSDEGFFKDVSGVVNYFKLRGSIGSAGNSSAILSSVRYDNIVMNYYGNNPALVPNDNISPGNPEIQWESTVSWNGGIEFGFLQNRINIVADLYSKKTSNLIGKKSLPLGTGFIDLPANIGDLTNTGFEVSLSAKIIQSRYFKWQLNTNLSTNKNKLTNASVPLSKSGKIANGVGENYNSFYIPVWAGVNADNGMPQWFDENGKPTSNYSLAKFMFVGKPQPEGFGAITNTFSYRGLELSAMFYFQYGFKTYNDNAAQYSVNDGSNPFLNQSTAALNRWQKPGDIAANPRRLLYVDAAGNRDQGNSISTRYLFDGDFVRLSNLLLAYQFNSQWLSKYKINALRLFVQGHNLATWTKYKGNDPENVTAAGSGNTTYPIQRTYSIGLNITF